MSLNKIILSAVTTGFLATGIFAAVPHQQAEASVLSKGGIILQDDSRILEHEVDYVGVLLDKKTDKKTKAGIRAYFKLLGYKSAKDFLKAAKAQGLDTSKYDYLLKK